MPILTTPQIKAYCRNEIPTDDDEFFDVVIEDVDDYLFMELGRQVAVASTSSARVFVPESSCLVRIDDCTSIVSVTNDGAAETASDYQLEPLNGRSAGVVVPYDRIRLIGGSWHSNGMEATVSVTATWGWAAIPPRLTQAALMVAKERVLNRDVLKLGIAGFVDPVAREIVAETIAKYRRVEAWGIA